MQIIKRIIIRILMIPQRLVGFIKSISKAMENSYWPDEPHKSRFKQICELINWRFKNKEINEFYTLYGFDRKNESIDQTSYIDYRSFAGLRWNGNKNGTNYSQVALLRDKYLFFKFMSLNRLPVPKVFAERISGCFFDSDLNQTTVDSILSHGSFFAKSLDGECGENVKLIEDHSAFSQYLSSVEKSDLVFQDRVVQHHEMSRLNPHSVNTIRLVTVNNNNDVQVFGALLRVGTVDSKERDNTSQGGIAIGINPDGSLTPIGIRKPKYGGRIEKHPDTGVVFSSFTIPYYKEAVELACRAHRAFYRVGSIGWDIAITPDGPVFIEGNDNWEIQSFQALYGGLRDRCNEMMSVK